MIEKLSNAFGVSGNEDEVRDIIIEEIKPYCDSIIIDKMGNIIAHKQGTKKNTPKIMVAAHMDEVGFMITSIEENGLLKFTPAGGIDKRVLIGKRIVIGKDKLHGIIIFKPIHAQRNDYKKIPDWKDLYIDIGCKDKKDAQKYVSIGDYAVFATEFEKRGKIIKGKAFDDRLGTYSIIEILKRKLKNSIYAVFTVQEEVGLRGAVIAAYNVMPDYTVILEGTSAADMPHKKDEADFPIFGKGVVLTISDRGLFVNRKLLDFALKSAKKHKIKTQFKQPMIGGTDAGVIHITGKGSKALVLAVPCRYIHSPVGFAHMDDVNAMTELGYNLINEINKGA